MPLVNLHVDSHRNVTVVWFYEGYKQFSMEPASA